MKVIVQFEHDEMNKKKKRKLESLDESTQVFYESKQQKGRDRKKKHVHDKKLSKRSVSLYARNNSDDDVRERKKFKASKDHLLKSLCNSDDEEDQVPDNDEETPSQPQVQIKEENAYKENESIRQSWMYQEKMLKEKEHKRIENLTPEQDERIKQIYKEQYKKIRTGPFLELKEAGKEASLSTEEDIRYPLVFPDIEEVLTHLQYNRHLTRWLHLKRATKVNNTILLSVEGPGLEDYLSQVEDCPTLQSCRVGVEFVSPLSYGDCVEHAFASKLEIKPPPEANIKEGFQNMKSCPKKDGFIVGLDTLFNIKWNSESNASADKTEADNKVKRSVKKRKASKIDRDLAEVETDKETDPDGNGQNFLDSSDVELEDSYDFCIKNKQALPISLFKRDKFSRLDLIMTPREMANHKYPLPFIPRYQTFVRTKDEYKEITERSPMFGLDCEMCETKAGSELTRISVVNEKHEVVYEKLVKPDNKIINYLTKYSGITAKMLNPVQTKLADVQRELKTLLPADAILVGQSLNCDLIAMKMMHPYIIDTSLIFNLTGIRQCKTKLKTLCAEFLSERIQISNRKGHNSIEDALAALKLVQKKLNHSLEWGDAVLGYKRTEEECRKANLELMDKEKKGVKAQTRLRLALNAIVDDLTLFDSPPSPYHLAKQKKRCRPSNKHLYY